MDQVKQNKSECDVTTGRVIKQPWEMTQAEWLDDVRYEKSQGSRVRENWLSTHEGEVRQAIQHHKSVPTEVLRDYPELTNTPSPKSVKQPWEMMQAEYRIVSHELWEKLKNNDVFINTNFYQYSQKVPHDIFNASMRYDRTSDQNHYRAIWRALKEGKPVPAEVLRDYPELATTPAAKLIKLDQEALEVKRKIVGSVQTKKYRASLILTEAQLRQLWQKNKHRHTGMWQGDTPQDKAAAMLNQCQTLDKAIQEIATIHYTDATGKTAPLGSYWADVLFTLQHAKVKPADQKESEAQNDQC